MYIVEGYIAKEKKEFIQEYSKEEYQIARDKAIELANTYHGGRFYFYVKGCHSMDKHYYQYDKYFGRATEFACND